MKSQRNLHLGKFFLRKATDAIPMGAPEFQLLIFNKLRILEHHHNPTRRCSSGVEQLIRNEQVVGSNPTSGSLIFNDLWIFIWLEIIRTRAVRHNLCLLKSRAKM